jgi:hypothetical protein
MKKTLLISALTAIVVFVVVYRIKYQDIFKHTLQGGGKEPITSFPPSSAWIIALPYALGGFVIVFLICWLIFKK